MASFKKKTLVTKTLHFQEINKFFMSQIIINDFLSFVRTVTGENYALPNNLKPKIALF